MATTTLTGTPALDRLAELRRAAADARRRVSELEAKTRVAPRQLAGATGRLSAYFADVESGGTPDPKMEKELRSTIKELQGRVVPRMTTKRGVPQLEHIDAEAEGRVHGAEALANDADQAVATFIVERRGALQAELMQRALDARDELLTQTAALIDASARWDRVRRDWLELGEPWGIAPNEVPANPLPSLALSDMLVRIQQIEGGARDPRGAIPMPIGYAPGAENDLEGRTTVPLRGWEQTPWIISSEGGLMGYTQ